MIILSSNRFYICFFRQIPELLAVTTTSSMWRLGANQAWNS